MVRDFAKAAVESDWVVQAPRPHVRATPWAQNGTPEFGGFEEKPKLNSLGQSGHFEDDCPHLWCKAIKRMPGHFYPKVMGFIFLGLGSCGSG